MMKRRVAVLFLALILVFAGFAVSESIGCPRINSSCPMMNGSSCSMMADGSCSMMSSSSCSMMSGGSCSMMAGDSCTMVTEHACPMYSGNSCSMAADTVCTMHDAEEYVYTEHVHSGYGEPAELLPCSVVNHTLYMDFMPPGFHYTLCEDCTLVTGFDIYLCMRSCTICGMHVHLQETEHDCPLRGTLVF